MLWAGIPVQPLERTNLALLHRTLHHRQLPLVVPVAGIYLHQPTWNALPRFWFLRFFIRDLGPRSAPDRPPILLNTFQGWPGSMPRYLCHLVD